ncbi:MAG TPA: filamentous hemagglutinin N-terminal domain-containing protein, partial [Ramlibacter sp.]|nr:filamentous hemagglutinin N-terminal domain-containing protein [Ramlibacter sp.]
MAVLPAAWANPQGPQVVRGSATFETTGSQLTVRNAPGTAINWQSFSIQPGERTHFQQQNAASTVLNRVVTPTPSQLLGTLSSNGKVVLINPHGIAVGAGASIDTAGFTASTMRISNEDWAAGRLRGPLEGRIDVQGQIRAQGGDIVLVARDVKVARDALVQAQDGTVVLAAGQQAEITGRGFEGIQFLVRSPDHSVRQLGRLEGDAVAVFAGTLRHSGLIRASRASVEGGKVVLHAEGAVRIAGGRVDATGRTGGRIDVQGERIAIRGDAVLDASGRQGGGAVQVGGGPRSDLSGPAAQQVRIGAQATLRADAQEQGNGGRIVVWADDSARTHGTLTARGGVQGGDGGFVETSGKRSLQVTRAADVSAPAGRGGTWLLDPENVVIGSGVGATMQASVLNTALNSGTNVVVETTAGGTAAGDIQVNAPITKETGADATLTLRAHNNVVIGSPITSSSNKLNLVLVADSDGSGGGSSQVNATVNTNGGTIDATQGSGVVHLGNVSVSGSLSAGQVQIASGLLPGALTLAAGTANWTAGTIQSAFTVAPGAVLNLAGTQNRFLSAATLTSAGTIRHQGTGALYLMNGAQLANQGLYDFQVDTFIGDNGGCGPCTLTNTGTFLKSGGTGNSDIAGGGIVFQGLNQSLGSSSGALRLTSGHGGHTHGGTLRASGNVQIVGGTHTLANGTSIQGTLGYFGGSLVNAGTTTLPAGTVFNWGAGTVIHGGSLSVAAGAAVNLLGSSNRFLSNSRLDNHGTVVFPTGTAGGLYLQNGAVLANHALLDFQIDALVGDNGGCGPCLFINNGTLRKSGGTGILDITGGGLQYQGTNQVLDIASGTLRFNSGNSGHTHGGPVTLQGDVQFTVGRHTFGDGSDVSGLLQVHGGDLRFGNATFAGGVQLTAGNLGGSAADKRLRLPAGTTLSWAGGSFISAGALAVDAGAAVDITGSANRFLSGVRLDNAGTIRHAGTGGVYLMNGAVLANHGVYEFQADNLIGDNGGCGPCLVVNTGTLHKTGGTGVSDITGGGVVYQGAGASVGASSGALRFNSGNGSHSHAGTVKLSGNVQIVAGVHTFADGAAIQGPLGYFGGSLVNSGTTTLASGSVLQWGANTAISGGSLAVAGGATLRMAGAGNRFLSQMRLVNQGTVVLPTGSSGGLYLMNGAVLDNRALLDFQVDSLVGDNGGCGPCLFINAGTLRKSGGTGTLDITGGGLQYQGGVGQVLDVDSGTVRFTSGNGGHSHAGPVTLDGNVQFIAGVHTFADGSDVTGTLNIAGADLRFGNARLGQQVHLSGGSLGASAAKRVRLPAGAALHWSGGSVSGGTVALEAGATTTVSGAANRFLNAATLENAGTINHVGSGPLYLMNGAVLANQGLLDFQADTFLGDNGGCGPCLIVNTGTIAKTAGTGNTDLAGGGVVFQGSNQSLGASSGALRFTSGNGSHTHAGSFTGSGNVQIAAGVHTFADGATLVGSLAHVGGTLANAGTTTVSAGSTLNWHGSTTISGGTLEVAAGGTVRILAGGNHFLSAARLENRGTVASSGPLYLMNSAVLDNHALLDFRVDTFIGDNGGCGPCLVINGGTIRKSGGTGAADLSGGGVVYQGTDATLDSGTGTLRFTSGNGSHSHAGATRILGDGVQIVAGTHTLDDGASVQGTLNLLGGTLASGGNATLAAGSLLHWGAGTFIAGHTLTVADGATLSLGSGNHFLSAGRIDNLGLLRFTGAGGALYLMNGAVLANRALLDFQVDGSIGDNGGCGPCLVINHGLVRKSGGGGNSDISGLGVVYQGTDASLGASSGALRFTSGNGSHVHAGSLTITGGNVQFAAGTHALADGAALHGTLRLVGGTLTSPGVATVAADGVLSWEAGTFITGSSLAVAPGGAITLPGGGNRFLSGARLENAGTVGFATGASGGLYLMNGAVLANRSVFEFGGDGFI